MICVPVTPEAVAAHYDELDDFYRDLWGEHVHHGLWLRGDETREEAVLQLVDLVAREAGFPLSEGRASARPRLNGESVNPQDGDVQKHVPPKICDIGCGYGGATRALAVRGLEVTGITISSAQFSVAWQRNGDDPKPQFILGDWLANDLPNESFDAAIAIESSEHMPDLRGFFAQAHRVLRNDGRLVICAWLSAEAPGARARKWLLEPICREGRMSQLGSANDYRALGEDAGFRLHRSEDLTDGVRKTWPLILRRLLGKIFREPRYMRFLFNRRARNRIFALTIVRIWLAYRMNALRYGIFTFVKSRRDVLPHVPI